MKPTVESMLAEIGTIRRAKGKRIFRRVHCRRCKGTGYVTVTFGGIRALRCPECLAHLTFNHPTHGMKTK